MLTHPAPHAKEEAKPGTGQVIADAIADLYAQQQVVTRETLVHATGLKLSVIDDHVGRMVDDGKLHRVRAGVFVPVVPEPEPRAITVTDSPDGRTIVEIGDMLVKLWPREARALGRRLLGDAIQFSNLQAGHEMGVFNSEILTRLRQLEAGQAALRASQDKQGELL